MKIILNIEQEALLLAWAAENTRAEIDAEVEPAGYRLTIDVSPLGCEAEASWGDRCLSVGPVEIQLEGGQRGLS